MDSDSGYRENNVVIRSELEWDEMRLFLVRHGQAAGEARDGEIGSPLTALGIRQAKRVAKRLANEHFDHIYSSDMSRAYDTARFIVGCHEEVPFTVDKDIREVERFHNQRGRAPRGVELIARMAKEEKAVARFCGRLVRKHCKGEQVMLVAHGNLIRYIIAVLGDVNPKIAIPLDTYNASVTVLTYCKNGYDFWNSPIRLGLVNCAEHLLARQKTGI